MINLTKDLLKNLLFLLKLTILKNELLFSVMESIQNTFIQNSILNTFLSIQK